MPLLPGQLAICIDPCPEFLTLHTVYPVLHIRETGGIMVDTSWPYFRASRFARFYPYIYTRSFLQRITCTRYTPTTPQMELPTMPRGIRSTLMSTPTSARSVFDDFISGRVAPDLSAWHSTPLED